jgi:hypothetical protein
MWTNSNHPEGAMRAELHISGSEDTCLHDLIEETAKPSGRCDEADEMVLIKTKLSDFFPVKPL